MSVFVSIGFFVSSFLSLSLSRRGVAGRMEAEPPFGGLSCHKILDFRLCFFLSLHFCFCLSPGGASPGGWKPSLHSAANAEIESRKRKFQSLATQAIERCEILKKAAAAIDGIPAPPDDDPIDGDGRFYC